jgi:hypothetical protein
MASRYSRGFRLIVLTAVLFLTLLLGPVASGLAAQEAATWGGVAEMENELPGVLVGPPCTGGSCGSGGG